MRLSQFLSTLTTQSVIVDLVDMVTGALIVSFTASGYYALEDVIEAREVKQWSITSLTHIRVVVGEAVEDEPETEPEPEVTP